MPTITTTITSAEASGSTTTVTTTQATPEAAAVVSVCDHGPEMFGGSIITVQDIVFDNAADKAAFVTNTGSVYAASKARNKAVEGYLTDTGSLSLNCIGTFGSEDDFLYAEGNFGKSSFIAGLLGKYSMTCYFTGAITPKVQARIDAWDQAPRFTCATVPGVKPLGTKIGKPLSNTGVGLVLRTTNTSKQDCDEYIAAHVSGMAAHRYHAFDTSVGFRISPTEIIAVVFSESEAKMNEWMTVTSKLPEISSMTAEHLPKMTSFGGHYFGNTAPHAETMKTWPMFDDTNLVGGSLGGQEWIMFQQMFFRTAAERNTFLAALDTLKSGSDSCYVGTEAGETGAWVYCCAKNTAEARKLQASMQPADSFMAATAGIAACPSYLMGNGVENPLDYAAWQKAFPALVPSPGTVMTRIVSGTAARTAESVSFIQDVEYNQPGDIDSWCELLHTDEVLQSIIKNGGIVCMQKISDTRAAMIISFPNGQAWLDFNVVLAKHAEAIGGWCKDIQCKCLGTISKETMATIEQWNAAPWCNCTTGKTYGPFAE